MAKTQLEKAFNKKWNAGSRIVQSLTTALEPDFDHVAISDNIKFRCLKEITSGLPSALSNSLLSEDPERFRLAILGIAKDELAPMLTALDPEFVEAVYQTAAAPPRALPKALEKFYELIALKTVEKLSILLCVKVEDFWEAAQNVSMKLLNTQDGLPYGLAQLLASHPSPQNEINKYLLKAIMYSVRDEYRKAPENRPGEQFCDPEFFAEMEKDIQDRLWSEDCDLSYFDNKGVVETIRKMLDENEKIFRLFEELPTDEQTILAVEHGRQLHPKMSQEEVAKICGISRDEYRRIIENTLKLSGHQAGQHGSVGKKKYPEVKRRILDACESDSNLKDRKKKWFVLMDVCCGRRARPCLVSEPEIVSGKQSQ